MKRHTAAYSTRALSAFVAFLSVAASCWVPTQAKGLSNEFAVARAAQAVMNQAAGGQLNEALAGAAALGRENDEYLHDTIATSRAAIERGIKEQRAVRSISTVKDSFFGGCIRHSYLLRQDGRNQRWMMKFRRSREGWTLKELSVSDA